MQALRRVAAAMGLALAGLLAAPLAQADTGTPHPISRTEGASRVMAVTAGSRHTCALQPDGSVACWGDNAYGRLGDALDGGNYGKPGPFLAVPAGDTHTCGLKPDGSVACWGQNNYGQAPASVAGPFLAVSAGGNHTCGLKPDGSVACWGDNYNGQLGDALVGGNYGKPGPFLAVSAGYYHTCGLKPDGSVACWGGNAGGRLGDALVGGNYGKPGPFLAVSTGYLHTCGLKPDGSVACWGYNGGGQLGDALVGGNYGKPGPFLAVSAGLHHTCGLKPDGSVACWGAGKTSEGSPSFNYGQSVDQPGPFLAVSAGDFHTCGLKPDGSVACWGAGTPGKYGFPHYGQSTVPTALQAPGNTAFGQIAAGNAHACQVRRDGSAACWGDNAAGQTTAPAGTFTQVVAGEHHSCALTADSRVTCWGGGILYPFGSGDAADRFSSVVALQSVESCGLKLDGSMKCWHPFHTRTAAGPFRNLAGNGSRVCAIATNGTGRCWTPGNAPGAPIPGNWQVLQPGLNHQCGLKVDGSIECMGDNSSGQRTGAPLATAKFRALSVGWNHACAIRTNGELACWGSNVNGQTSAPAGTFVQVAAGNTFTCAIRSDGVRLCWGAGNHGQVPFLQLLPASETLAGGLAGSAHAGVQFALTDGGGLYPSPHPPPSPWSTARCRRAWR
ncbi:chromosome condensation regulator RCC1 [Thermomonas brevis]